MRFSAILLTNVKGLKYLDMVIARHKSPIGRSYQPSSDIIYHQIPTILKDDEFLKNFLLTHEFDHYLLLETQSLQLFVDIVQNLQANCTFMLYNDYNLIYTPKEFIDTKNLNDFFNLCH